MAEDSPGPRPVFGLGRRLAVLALVVAACGAGGKIGLLVPIVHQRVTLLWPPTGIALAAVLLAGEWVWPGIFLASVLVSLSTRTPLAAALVIAAANTLQALAGGWLLRRAGFRNGLDRVWDVLALVVLGAGIPPVLSAVLGIGSLHLLGPIPASRVFPSMLSWWLGDAMGVLLLTPLLLTWLSGSFRGVGRERVLEAAALGLSLLAVGWLTLSSWNAGPLLHLPLAFTLFPFLVWAALRFGPRGAAGATVLAAGIALWATARGLVPFAFGTVEEQLMYLYSYIAVAMVTAMLLAAVFAERGRAEEQIREREERLRLALEAGRYGVWDWDLASQRLTWSKEIFAIHGISPEDFRGRLEDFVSHVHPEDAGRVGESIRLALAERKPYQEEFRIIRPSGEVRWISTNGQAVYDESGQPVRMLGATMDVTERHRAEEERARLLAAEREARAEAEEANEAKDRFLATLSHELRTPLTPVLAVVSRLETDAGLRPIADELSMIRRNVELEARLIDDLLDLTRIARGKLDLRLEVTDARKVIEHTIEICCAREVDAGRLRVVTDLAPADHRLWADPSRLTQVLWNLLNNAVKFTPVGGTLTVRSWREGERLLIKVSDTGVGIDPEALAHIFDAFEQGRMRSPRRTGGLGLGLAISKAIAEMHGGTLTAESAGRGQGATFALSLPSSLPEEAGEIPAAREPEIENRKSKIQNLRILLVEDHADTAEAMADLLFLMGHQVTTAGSVAEALAAAGEAGEVDLVISDLGLPDGSGLDLMRELSARHGLRGIALSGYGMEEDVRQSLEAGFLRHLTKPVSLPALQATLAEVAGGEA